MISLVRMSLSPMLKLNSGFSIPILGLGTWKSDPGLVRDAVVSAIENGYRHIDCAASYGNEAEVGEGIKICMDRGLVTRDELFITSKVRIADSSHPDLVEDAVDLMLSRLQLNYLNLVLIHWPFRCAIGKPFPPAKEDNLPYDREIYLSIWQRLESLVEKGKIQSIGVSNMTIKKLEELLPNVKIVPAMNQVELTPYLSQPALKEYCDLKGIALTAYSPLGSGDRPPALRVHDEEDIPILLTDPTVLKLAEKYKKTPAQILIRFAIDRGTVVIPKSTTPARIIENFSVFDFKLEDEDLKSLLGLNRNLRLIKGTPWLREGQDWRENWDEL